MLWCYLIYVTDPPNLNILCRFIWLYDMTLTSINLSSFKEIKWGILAQFSRYNCYLWIVLVLCKYASPERICLVKLRTTDSVITPQWSCINFWSDPGWTYSIYMHNRSPTWKQRWFTNSILFTIIMIVV